MDWRFYLDMEAVLRDINYNGGIEINNDEIEDIENEHKDDFLDMVENQVKKYILTHHYVFNIEDEDDIDYNDIEYEIEVADYYYDYLSHNNYDWEDDYMVGFAVDWNVQLRVKSITYNDIAISSDIEHLTIKYENRCYMCFDR